MQAVKTAISLGCAITAAVAFCFQNLLQMTDKRFELTIHTALKVIQGQGGLMVMTPDFHPGDPGLILLVEFWYKKKKFLYVYQKEIWSTKKKIG
jgi:hypothetical protein